MPCSGGSVSWHGNALIEDLLFVHPFVSTRRYQPVDLPELVSAVTQSIQAGRSIRAHGSNWSLSQAGVAQDVIDRAGFRNTFVIQIRSQAVRCPRRGSAATEATSCRVHVRSMRAPAAAASCTWKRASRSPVT